MGQNLSTQLEDIKDDVMKEFNIFKEVVDTSYDDFLKKLHELNKVCSKIGQSKEQKLHFCIEKDSDSTFLWKSSVRVKCIRVTICSSEANNIFEETLDESKFYEQLANTGDRVEVLKVLNMRQFLLAHKIFLYHCNCIPEANIATSSNEQTSLFADSKPFSASMLLEKIVSSDTDSEECIICLERKPEVTLPCAHAYCLFCIEQWNVSNKTCPICRTEVKNTDESWVTPEIPGSSEVNAEIQKALENLTRKLPGD